MYIIKRNGEKQEYNSDKIIKAVEKADISVNGGKTITNYQLFSLLDIPKDRDISVEEIQDKVEIALMKINPYVAKAFILYREKHKLIRESNTTDQLAQETKISVSDIEVENDRPLKAIDVFEIIEKKFQENDIYFLMGEDNYLKMSSWSNYNKLLKYKYIVFQRKRESSINKENVLYINSVENLNISSSIIREKIKNNESITNLVTSDIEKYIKENKLYIKKI